jgi:hypothetical protein
LTNNWLLFKLICILKRFVAVVKTSVSAVKESKAPSRLEPPRA